MRPPFVSARRGVVSALILATSFGLSACYVEAGINGTEDSVIIEPTRDTYLPGDALSVTVTNTTRDRLLLTTCGSELEHEVNGTWVRVVYDLPNFGCPDGLLSMGRRESRTFQVDILTPTRRLPTNLAQGRYRIVLPEMRDEGSYDSYLKNDRRSDSFWVE